LEQVVSSFYAGLDRASPYILSLVRIVAALLFLEHGTQKFLSFPAPFPYLPLSTILTIQGVLEILGGLLLLVGFQTRPVAFILSGNMAFAYFMAHASKGLYPALNGGDAAILYCFVFLYLVFAGGGPLGLDRPAAK
jgi:putative oxidoreductase